MEHYAAVGPERMGAHPIGTGPYRVVSVEPGKAYRMVRNDHYFKGSPKGDHFIKTIDVREMPDGQTQVAELLARRADIIWGISTDQLRQIGSRNGFKVARTETMGVGYLGLDAAGRSGTPALQDVDVRRAIAYAVNRQSIVQTLMGAPARVIDSPCHPQMFGCSSEAARHYDYAPDKARNLLHASGYEGKLAFDLYVEPLMKAAGEAVATDLGKVGIMVRLRTLDRSALNDAQIGDRTPMVLLSSDAWWMSDVAELLDPSFLPGRQDYARDPELRAALKDALATMDSGKRRELDAKAIERITDQVVLAAAVHLPAELCVQRQGEVHTFDRRTRSPVSRALELMVAARRGSGGGSRGIGIGAGGSSMGTGASGSGSSGGWPGGFGGSDIIPRLLGKRRLNWRCRHLSQRLARAGQRDRLRAVRLQREQQQ